MIRVKYCLCSNGTQPQDAIIAAVPGMHSSQLNMGMYCQMENNVKTFYGEIDTDSSNQAAIISSCGTMWSMVVLTDQEAIDFADASMDPIGTQIQEPMYIHGARIDAGRLVKEILNTPPS